MYNPHQLKEYYDNLEHGEARISAIRHAVEEADKNNDLPFQLYFRMDLCHESQFYNDALDCLIIFPEALALVDKHPDIPNTQYSRVYNDGMDHILWVYKWILGSCSEYYQIPLQDCLDYMEDFKKRSLAYGYNLKPYYKSKTFFYKYIDMDLSNEYFDKYEKIPRDSNCDCAACDRNREIEKALSNNNLGKAHKLSEDIENFSLKCNSEEPMAAWLRMKGEYLSYYLRNKDFDNAERYCKLIEHNMTTRKEDAKWNKFLYCYAHTNMGKALKIYKNYWKELLTERCPYDAFNNYKYTCAFFNEMKKQANTDTIMLELDNSFPLYNPNNEYIISDMEKFYYNKALEIAQKFDQRNQSSYFMDNLNDVVQNP